MFFLQNDPGLFLAIKKHDPYDGHKKLKQINIDGFNDKCVANKEFFEPQSPIDGCQSPSNGLEFCTCHMKKVFRGTIRSYLNGCFKFLVHFVPFRGD